MQSNVVDTVLVAVKLRSQRPKIMMSWQGSQTFFLKPWMEYHPFSTIRGFYEKLGNHNLGCCIKFFMSLQSQIITSIAVATTVLITNEFCFLVFVISCFLSYWINQSSFADNSFVGCVQKGFLPLFEWIYIIMICLLFWTMLEHISMSGLAFGKGSNGLLNKANILLLL